MGKLYTTKIEYALKKRLEYYPVLSRMMYDDTFFDVTTTEAKYFLSLIDRYGLPNDIRIKLHKKYAAYVPQDFSCFHKAVLNYDLIPSVHDVCTTAQGVHINGYTENEWNLLTREEYVSVSRARLAQMRNKCIKKQDEKALMVLSTKYGAVHEEERKRRNEEILISHNLPPDTNFTTISTLHIDGITFNCWRLLHDDDYDPSQAILISNYHLMKRIGRAEDVAYIGDKYHEELFPKEVPVFSQEEIEQALSFFNHYHDNLI